MKKPKIVELYGIYSRERDNNKVQESSIIIKDDIEKLLPIAENY